MKFNQYKRGAKWHRPPAIKYTHTHIEAQKSWQQVEQSETCCKSWVKKSPWWYVCMYVLNVFTFSPKYAEREREIDCLIECTRTRYVFSIWLGWIFIYRIIWCTCNSFHYLYRCQSKTGTKHIYIKRRLV